MSQHIRERRPRLAGALVACLAVALVAGTARADAGPDPASDRKAAARAKLVEGDHLLKGGEFQQALAAFKEAFDLFPSPKIHYNFALALQGMGRNADALEAFEVFLKDATDASPDARARASAAREGLLQRVGMLRVSTEAAGAQVVVDGRDAGRTPLARAIPLDVGPHLLLVDRGDGSAPYTKRFQIAGGATVEVHLGADDLSRPRIANGASEPAKPAEVPPESPATAASVQTEHGSPDGARRWRTAGVATASGGALLIGGGALFGLAARSASQDVSRQYDANRDSAGKRYEVLQWVGYGLGAAAVVTGALLYLHGAHADGDESTTVHALVTTNGVLLEGHF